MKEAKDKILRRKILDGADKLFREHGLSKTTMEDIAREAGKGKSTLYYYFKSKEEIIDAIIEEDKDQFFNKIQTAVAAAPTAKEKVHAFVETRFARLKEFTTLYKIMISEVREALGDQCVNKFRYRKQYDQKEADIIKSILQYGATTGEFRAFSDKDLDMMSFVFLSSQHGLELDMIMYDKVDEMMLKMSFLLDIMLNGVNKK